MPAPEEPPEGTTRPPRLSILARLRHLGPGVVTGAASADPAGIGTYAQAGAATGYGLLWLLFITTPMHQVVQVTCAKFGIRAEKGLAAVLKQQYGVRVALLAVVLTAIGNVATIGADIAGTAAAMGLIFHARWQWFVIPITVVVWYFQVYMDYAVIRRALMVFAVALSSYVLAGFLARPDWLSVLTHSIAPRFTLDRESAMLMVAMIGTTIGPYMMFFQPAQEVEERRTVKRLPHVTADTTGGIVYAHVVAYFIVLATAATLNVSGKTDIHSAAEAAQALRPVAGRFAELLFAAGMIGSGFLALPVLAASTATMVGEVAGWRVGMRRSASRAEGFYAALTVALLVGAGITLSGIDPIKALFYSQIANGVVAPLILFLVFRLAGRAAVLGDQRNTTAQQAWGWLTVCVMSAAVLLLAWALWPR